MMIDVPPFKATRIPLLSLSHQPPIRQRQLPRSFPSKQHSLLISDHRHPSQRSHFLSTGRTVLCRDFDKRDAPVFTEAVVTETRQLWVGVMLKAALVLSIWLCFRWMHPRSALAQGTSSSFSIVDACRGFIDFVLHLDVHLSSLIAKHGAATYALLFGIVFCETGLVLTPFLPGDSLLFAAGALAGFGKFNILYLSVIFISAAIFGDAVNYALGAFLGQRAVQANWVPAASIEKTESFFEKYGGKTIVLARFVPIVRTFAPFVAGISRMEYRRFAAFNIGGAVLWTFLLCGAGYFFGNLPFVEKNFALVIVAVVILSVLPIVYEVVAAKQEKEGAKGQSSEGSSDSTVKG